MPLLLGFLAVTLLPAGGLVWLGWKLLDQDRALESQRRTERQERALDALAASLEQRLSAVERHLADPVKWETLAVEDDAVAVEFSPQGVRARPQNRLLYYPWLPPVQEAAGDMFAAGEEHEFRKRDYPAALAAYRVLARSPDSAVRAGALLRVARTLRKSGQAEVALETYRQLAGMEQSTLGGIPAGLLARRARCALLGELERAEELRTEARELHATLLEARWPLTRSAYIVHMQDARAWSGADRAAEAGAEALAAAVEKLWQTWRLREESDAPDKGRESIGESRVTAVWVRSGERCRAFLALPSYVEKRWLAATAPLDVRLTHTGARSAGVVQRTAQETGLPWSLILSATQPESALVELSGRRKLLLSGLALIGVLVLAGTYFIGRSVARELAAARLQTEFVAAVSHEFRTPLTSLRQFTEILSDHRVPEENRDPYYHALGRATRRLQRLVESLLDFGRMEAGAAVYRFEPLDVAEWVETVVSEFRTEVQSRGYEVELRIDGRAAISADPEALTRALWNLLDNAVKYSPKHRTVWVEAGIEGNRAVIQVRDRGLGIAPEERHAILRKFVRGSSAKRVEGKGTGIGLAMVNHIVTAHHGELRVESRPGEGSAFTILLPVRS